MSVSILVAGLSSEEAATAIRSYPTPKPDVGAAYLCTVSKQGDAKPWLVRNLHSLTPRVLELRNIAILWDRSSPGWRVVPSDTLALPTSLYFRQGFAALALSHVAAETATGGVLQWFDNLNDLQNDHRSPAIEINSSDTDTRIALELATAAYLSGAAACLSSIALPDVMDVMKRRNPT